MHFSSPSNLSKLHYPTEKYMTFFVSWKTYTEKIIDSHISMQVNMDELLCKAGLGDNCAMSCISHLSFCSQTGSENYQLGVFAFTWEILCAIWAWLLLDSGWTLHLREPGRGEQYWLEGYCTWRWISPENVFSLLLDIIKLTWRCMNTSVMKDSRYLSNKGGLVLSYTWKWELPI